MKRSDLEAQVAALTKRVDALERKRRQDAHVHNYAYSKRQSGTPESFGGVGYSWSWDCIDRNGERSKDCPTPGGLTNYPAGIPSHFPKDLR